MKKVVAFIAITLFLISFIAAASITSEAIKKLKDEVDDNSEDLPGTRDSSDDNSNDSDLNDDSSDDINDSDENEQESPEIEDENETNDDSFSREKIEDRIRSKLENSFCGTSTFAECNVDNDCINGGCSSAVCQGVNEEPAITTCEYRDCYNAGTYKASCRCIKNRCMWNKITEEQIRAIIASRNKIKVGERECAENCECMGSVIKCILEDGTREMTITAGNSGNIIIQVKGINGTTNVTLYKHDGKIYAVNKNNETIRLRLFPDHVREKIRERLQKHLEGENITLDEEGIYLYKATKKAKLFFLFPVDVEVTGEFDAETGRIIQIKNSWWAFLAKDDAETEAEVTVCTDNSCCEEKEFDFYNSETKECEFEED